MSGDVARRRATRALVGGLIAVTAALLVWAIPPTVRFFAEAPSAFWAITLMAVLVDIPVFALARGVAERTRTTLSVCFTFAIFLLWGAAPAIVVQAVAAAVAGLPYQRFSRAIFLISRLVCALAAAELAVLLTTGRPLTTEGSGLTGHAVLAFLWPAVVWFGVSFGLHAVARSVSSGTDLWSSVASLREEIFATATAILLLSTLLTTMTGWWTVLVAVPVLAWNQLSREYTRREQRLRREPVTGLLNRRGLILGTETLTAEDLLDPGRSRPFGIILLNVESVLAVNKTLGRDLYERVVAAAGRRLARDIGADRVGRLSGEGFVIIVPDATEHGALAVAAHAVDLLAEPLEVDDIPFALDPAAGVALAPQHGRDFTTLVAKAEFAMAEARRAGAPAALYVRHAREVAQRRIQLLQEVRAVLRDPARHHEIEVYYQPQVDVRTGRLASAEALVRWTHPVWGPVSPDEMIEAVEPTEVMHLLTRHMLDRVCAQLQAWERHDLRVRVAVNASMQDLRAPDFAGDIRRTLDRYGIPPDQLTIEITERMLTDDSESVGRAATRIAALGVGLSLDDFGTGYASLQQLRVLPLTEVKIDKSYVQDMTVNTAQRAIVTSVHQLARALRLAVVAEGVEDARTAIALARLPGTIGQGWHFGHPVPAPEFQARWHRHRMWGRVRAAVSPPC